jgi:hypothetical protein
VTRLERLDTRLREQGADRAAHLRTVTNGRVAREIEAGIAERVGDAVRTPTKRRGLHLSVDEAAWSDLLSGFDPIDTAAYRYDHDVETRPLAATTAAGRVRGAQGRLLVLNRHGTTYAVDLRDLVGHAVTGSTDERALQSSLGAF